MPFNIPDDLWDRAVDEIRERLIPVARSGGTIAYSELARGLTSIRTTADAKSFHEMLGDVSRRAFDAGAPLLSAVVVHKDDGKPGGGFCRMARGIGFDVPQDSAAEDVFWAEQRELLREWWRRR